MIYRLYIPEDFDRLYALEEACFDPPGRFSRRYMRLLVQRAHAATWIAEEAGQLAGFAIVDWVEGKCGVPSDGSSSQGPEAEDFEALGLSHFAVNKTVMRISPAQLVKKGLPEALAETLLHVPLPAGASAWALVCHHRTCLPPITDAKALAEALENTGFVNL